MVIWRQKKGDDAVFQEEMGDKYIRKCHQIQTYYSTMFLSVKIKSLVTVF